MKTPIGRRAFIKAAVAATAGAPMVLRGVDDRGFEIGLAADAQFADIDAKGTRFYRQSIGRLGEAVEHFNGRDLAFCVHLGDLIDREWKSFEEIGRPLRASRQRWHHLLGNHDFEVLDEQKAAVPGRLGMARRHGTFSHHGFCFVVLDTNDVSTYAHAAGTRERSEAELELARLQKANVRQAKSWNGAVGAKQLAWLEQTFVRAAEAAERVIIFAHHPIWPDNEHNLWNAAAVLALIERHPHVVAWINGHNHAGAFAEKGGVPFVTLKGMVETADTSAFATARILGDRLLLTGHGREPSRELKFRS